MLSRGVKGGVSGLVDKMLPNLAWCEESETCAWGDGIAKRPVAGDWGDPMAEQSDVVRERCILDLEGQPL